ncbi:MAG: short-subunit dehydrogenase [Myxococcota bacterium]|jgi:short-subunit dehydrogenase
MHIVVTGASAGIGAALARAFATLPTAHLTLVARRADRLHALAAELGVPTLVVPHDLSDPVTATAWLPDAVEAHGPVDVLVNNAGLQVVGPTHTVDLAAAEASVAVNLLAPLRLTAAVLPSMRERGTGTIVDVTSMAALAPTPGMTWYNASKAGLAAASEALRGELRDTGVHVVTVYPGIVRTDMATRALAVYGHGRAVALQPVVEPADLAAAVVDAVVHRRSRVILPRMYGPARWLGPAVRWALDRFTPTVEVAA